MDHVVIGSNGQIGRHLLRNLTLKALPAFGYSRSINDFDLTDPSTFVCLNNHPPGSYMYITAGISSQRDVRDDPGLSYNTNVKGIIFLLDLCLEKSWIPIFLSSEAVFGISSPSLASNGWKISDSPCPLSLYGSFKSIIETYIRSRFDRFHIVRTGWIVNLMSNHFPCVISLTLDEIKLINACLASDLFLNLTELDNFVETLIYLAQHDSYGVFHLVDGSLSRLELGFAICKFFNSTYGSRLSLNPVISSDLSFPEPKMPYCYLEEGWPGSFGCKTDIIDLINYKLALI